MFTANLADHKIRHEELIRQAEHYRLVKMAEGSRDLFSRIGNALGKLMVNSGRQLLTPSEAVQ